MDYAKLYNALISFRKSNLLLKSKELYTEVHHIVPKCLGGSDDHENLVRLTAREHFIAHRLLAKMYPESSGLSLTILNFKYTRDGHRIHHKEFERLRNSVKDSHSKFMLELWEDKEFRNKNGQYF